MEIREAIAKIKQQKLEFLEEYVDYSGVAEAYDMAISALEKQFVNDSVCMEGKRIQDRALSVMRHKAYETRFGASQCEDRSVQP